MASRVVRARLDDPSARGLAILMREGRNESEAVRAALIESGQRRLRRSALAADARRIAHDPTDVIARREAMADMEPLSADWPE
jgi:hypothetical protein